MLSLSDTFYSLAKILAILFSLSLRVRTYPQHTPHAVACSTLIVFGDGLSDDGAEVGVESHGFLRNSNGPIWPEYLRGLLECSKYFNYAYSGAKSGVGNFYFEKWSGVLWQVEQFVNRRYHTDKDAIIILQVGGIIDMFGGETNTSTILTYIKDAVILLRETVPAGHIILMNLPELSLAPGMKYAEEGALIKENFVTLISQVNNQMRPILLEHRPKRSTHLSLRMFDLNTAIFKAISHLNSTEPFSYQRADTKLRDVYHYAYHDLWHPTTTVHYEIAKDLMTFLEDG